MLVHPLLALGAEGVRAPPFCTTSQCPHSDYAAELQTNSQDIECICRGPDNLPMHAQEKQRAWTGQILRLA